MKYLLLFTLLSINKLYSQNYLDYYFKSNNINGAIVIYNENRDEWLFNSETEPFYNTPAAAYFHLWQTLVGLEYNVFNTDVKEVLKWDGVKRSFFNEKAVDWNKNTNLIEALLTKNDWYFDRLQFELSKEIYDSKIKNAVFFKDIKNNELEYFWNYAALTNPNTMILFIKDLYSGNLPFYKKNQNFLYNQFLKNENLAIFNSQTSYLGKKIDWTVGVYTKHKKPIYFSLRVYHSLDENEMPNYEQRKNLVLSQIFEVLNLN